MPGSQRQDLEVGFDGAYDLPGGSLWRAWAGALFVGVPDETKPHPAGFQIPVDLLCELRSVFVRPQYMKTAPIECETKRRGFEPAI